METQRLLFREIEVGDTDRIVEWRSDYDVYRFFVHPHKLTIEEHLNWYHNIYLLDEKRTDFMAIEKSSMLPIGVFGLIKNENTVEVNYLLSKEARGKGYAMEAVDYLLRYAKNKWSPTKFIAEIHKENLASISLIKRMGFTEVLCEENMCVFEKQT